MGLQTTAAMRAGQLKELNDEFAGLLRAPVLVKPTQLSISFQGMFRHGLDGAHRLSKEIETLTGKGIDCQNLDEAYMSILNSLTQASHWLRTYIADLETPPTAKS